jgi:hypothetical protein
MRQPVRRHGALLTRSPLPGSGPSEAAGFHEGHAGSPAPSLLVLHPGAPQGHSQIPGGDLRLVLVPARGPGTPADRHDPMAPLDDASQRSRPCTAWAHNQACLVNEPQLVDTPTIRAAATPFIPGRISSTHRQPRVLTGDTPDQLSSTPAWASICPGAADGLSWVPDVYQAGSGSTVSSSARTASTSSRLCVQL